MIKMPKSTTINAELQQLAKLMRISYFRDIFISRTNGGSIPKRNLYIVNL